jgi:peptide/nickel transport system permease protein
VTRVVAFLLRRFVTGVFTLCALLALTFVVYWALPSQPARFVYPSAQQLSNYQVAHANHLLGLDKSKPVQYVDYLRQLARGDVGRFWTGSQLIGNKQLEQSPIGPTLFPSLRITLSIIFGGAVLVLLLALPLGALAGSRIGSARDRVISSFSLLGICTHPMVLGLILASTFGTIGLGWLPGDGYCPLFRGPTDQCGGLHAWSVHLILPWLTFAFLFLALYTRMVRISVAETLHEDFVRTARAKGLPERRVLRSHVLPSASLRVLTMVGMEIGTAIGVCIYVEAAFRFNGLGRQAVIAMGGASFGIDLPFTLAIVFLISVIVIVGNLVVDVLYAVLDPRAGRETARGREKPLVGGVF